ncbi:MAG: phospho-sugar mutase [Firmicutes bacterium]|nr:phospho-sugar mutase [Bacillota bacterium]
MVKTNENIANQRFDFWSKNVSDKNLKNELEQLKNDSQKRENAFYRELEFGTAGLRGILGVGTNMMNIHTVTKATYGIVLYMKENAMKSIAISYDSRINSELFAKCVASVCASFGIKVYLSPLLMPTPFLSYMVRDLKCDMGIMITASHNPANYNGYKVYGADGCQITDSVANNLISIINKIDPFSVKTDEFEKMVKNGLIQFTDDEIVNRYIADVKKQSIHLIKNTKILFTPLNGTGFELVPRILKECGLKKLEIVAEQSKPDGNFPTCPYPNPENAEALSLGIKKAKEIHADIVIATDPDADRMGLVAKNKEGDYKILSGNEIGVLLTDFIFSKRKESNTLPKDPVYVKTIVSTPLAAIIAEKYGAEVFNVLTGFKYIGEVIGRLEAKGEENRFVFGFEESLGFLAGTHVRDKDAVVASMLTAEMTEYYLEKGKTLVCRLKEIHDEYGEMFLVTKSYKFPGAEGATKMQKLLDNFRKKPFEKLAGDKVISKIDYLAQTEFELPKSNVLFYATANGSLIIRPSGTEPLIKAYMSAKSMKILQQMVDETEKAMN